FSLSASGLPSGATFDAASGTFEWTPAQGDLGKHTVRFVATNALGNSITKDVDIVITGGSELPAPEILTVGDADGNQALAIHQGSSMLASIPDVRFNGRPALGGDILLLTVSGLNCANPSALPAMQLHVGDRIARIHSIQPLGENSNSCQLT